MAAVRTAPVLVSRSAHAFIPGRFMLPATALWIAFSSSRGFGLPKLGSVPQVTLARLLLLSLVACGLLSLGVRRGSIGRPGHLELGLWLMTAWAAISGFTQGFFRDYPPSTELLLNQFLFPAIAFSLLQRTDWDDRDLAHFVQIFLLFGIYLGCTAILEKLEISWALFPSSIADPTQGIHYGRARGPFLQAAFNGAFMAQLLPLAVLTLSARARLNRWIAGAALPLLCLGIYLTDTRAALLSLAAIIALGSLVPSPSRRIYRRALAALASGGVAVYVLGQALVPRMQEVDPITDRFSLLLSTAEMTLAHPVTGVGYARFELAQEKYYNAGKVFGSVSFSRGFGGDMSSHCMLLTPFAEMGVIAGVGFVLLLAVPVLQRLVAARPRDGAPPERRAILLCAGLVGLAFIMNGLFADLRFALAINAMMWVFMAVSQGPSGIDLNTGRPRMTAGRVIGISMPRAVDAAAAAEMGRPTTIARPERRLDRSPAC